MHTVAAAALLAGAASLLLFVTSPSPNAERERRASIETEASEPERDASPRSVVPLPLVARRARTAASGPSGENERAPPLGPQNPVLRAAFERGDRDAMAGEIEQRIAAAFTSRDGGAEVFRSAACSRAVCKIALNFSPSLSEVYNEGLSDLVRELGRDVSFEPEGQLDTAELPVKMTVFIARRGYDIPSLAKELGGSLRAD